MNIVEEAHRLRKKAHAGPIGKRHSSFELYELLADCMELADNCRLNLGDSKTLRDLVRAAGKRRWVENLSDEYLLVCRFVFPNASRSGERSNASRYALTLREAAKRQIRPQDLVQVLKTQGGINALYLQRPLDADSVSTKTLHLRRAIVVKKGVPFMLKLKRLADNSFEVLSEEPAREKGDRT